MSYLALATICSASIALLFKFAAVKELDQKLLTVANYVTASAISIFMIVSQNQMTLINFNQAGFINALFMGIGTGIFYLLSFVFYQMSIRKNGASISGMFAKLGILIPMIVSIIIWKEYPTMIQVVGILMALCAIAVANFGPRLGKNSHLSSGIIVLMLLFFSGGIGEFLNKIFQTTTSLEYKPIFLLFVFSTALCISLGMHFNRKDHVKQKKNAFLVGILVGIPNLFASFFLIDALDTLPASVVFPAYSAGTILLITLLSVLIFKEKLYRKDYVAILLTSLSLILMNL